MAAATEQDIGSVERFPDGSRTVVEIAGRQVGVFNVDGELHALPNVCPHQTGPLCEVARLTGTFRQAADGDWRKEWVHDGEIVACPWHGLEFHVPTGRCLAYPHIQLRRYSVRVAEGRVLLSVGGRRAAAAGAA
ncbi:Rieske (2Fe-2S) protein [Conexibacter woesei]|uniref:Rieske (2Fe-2S) iron-sulphur domain protein n=1 Tax=Conexibacter woesei (strain DSM 14684 / CCUG 47730 / CIP 108061 / JCM 11494 / NBRC 100937 / ID131577) TaxID=469383 RepID=D3F9T8_CONWI|nr:Rieske 2Fe-2S domain-containing protein [Conexibacter woesei]ADB51150.1 Rieske (2Fe-2S) iron-sulphur domain protein [Conexibacter woesei DSM 14684]